MVTSTPNGINVPVADEDEPVLNMITVAAGCHIFVVLA